MKVQIEVPDKVVPELIRYSSVRGFKRENPRVAWTDNDRKQAVRYALHQALEAINSTGDL